MNVKTLIEQLRQHDPEMEVRFAYPLGDYGRNTAAAEPSNVEVGEAVKSGHLADFILLDEEDDRDDFDTRERHTCVIIK